MVKLAAKTAFTLVVVVSVVGALAGVAVAGPKPSPSPAPSPTAAYSVTALPSLAGLGSVAVALNNNGQVTGYSYTGKTITLKSCCGGCYPGGPHNPCTEQLYHAVVWSNGTITDLGTLGGDDSAGKAINLSGEVVGWAQTKSGPSSPFLWNGGKLIDLTSLAGASVAGINDPGQIVGTNPIAGAGQDQPFLDSNGKITLLPLPSFASASRAVGCSALAINNSGVVLGGCDDANSFQHGVIWQNGTPTDLGTLGGQQTGVSGINNNGQVVGSSQTSTDADHGFVWSNGTMTDLGPNFFPAAINDNGVIVGGQEIYSNGTFQNLNNLIAGTGYQISSTIAINDNGQILATDGGQALLLTPN